MARGLPTHLILVAVVWSIHPAAGLAANDPDDTMLGRVAIVRPGLLARFVSTPTPPFILPSASVTSGTLALYDTAVDGAGANTYLLGAGTWTGLGNPAGSNGWRYRGAGSGADPCRVVVIKTSVVKGICRGTAITLAPPFSGNLVAMLEVGPIGMRKRYCSYFGGTPVQNLPTVFKRTNAPPPGSCPTVF